MTGGAHGIKLNWAADSTVAGNRVSKITSPLGSRIGTQLDGNDLIVGDNRVSGARSGIVFGAATGIYINNVAWGATLPYSGGTAAGATNFRSLLNSGVR